MRSIVKYIGNTTDKITEEEVREGIITALPQTGEQLMSTLFQKIEERGFHKGRVEGRVVLLLELKYEKEGLAFFQHIKNSASLDTLTKIEEAIRNDATLNELEQIVRESNSKP